MRRKIKEKILNVKIESLEIPELNLKIEDLKMVCRLFIGPPLISFNGAQMPSDRLIDRSISLTEEYSQKIKNHYGENNNFEIVITSRQKSYTHSCSLIGDQIIIIEVPNAPSS